MKRTVVLFRPYAGAGSLLLVLSVLYLAGCSGGDAVGNAAEKYGLEKSEFIALKKASKGHSDFKKAILKQRIEKFKEQGVVVETTPSGKKTNKPR